jgi:hypothetical protein
MFDLFGYDRLSPVLEIFKIKEHKFLEENKKIFFLVEARLTFTSGQQVIIKEMNLRDFYFFFDGKRSIFDKSFAYKGLVFFDTEESKAIKKQIDEIAEKFFPQEEVKESENK